MPPLDYSNHFWGDKHIGYHVLYENLKRSEDTVQELGNFLKERLSAEEDVLKSLNKSLNRVNNYIAGNGAFVDTWRLTKGTLELWAEIQASALRGLGDLSKEIAKYHDGLVRSRKRVKEDDVLDSVNLMQTTTTCLQKAKETYSQRCTELANLMRSDPTNSGGSNNNTKEFSRARSKLQKAHDEYRAYVEKYNQVRDTFEAKMLKATKTFQAHDAAHLTQMRRLFITMATSLEEARSATVQVTTDYRQNLEQMEVEGIMGRFVDERATGTERPQPITWTSADEIPSELLLLEGAAPSTGAVPQLISAGGNSQSAPSSSNSSAVMPPPHDLPRLAPTIDDLLGLEKCWPPPHTSTSGSIAGAATTTAAGEAKLAVSEGDGDGEGEGDGESDEDSAGSGSGTGTGAQPHNPQQQQQANAAASYVPQQFSSWLGRQKLTQWRRKHSASQSNLASIGLGEGGAPERDFSSSYNEGAAAAGTTRRFLGRYRKSKPNGGGGGGGGGGGEEQTVGEDARSTASSSKSEGFGMGFGFGVGGGAVFNQQHQPQMGDPFGLMAPTGGVRPPLPPPLPTSEPPPLLPSATPDVDEEGFSIPKTSTPNKKKKRQGGRWFESGASSSSSSSSDDEENALQTSKIKTLQIRPLNSDATAAGTGAGQKASSTASVEELKSAVGYITLPRSISTIERDPWGSTSTPAPIRPTLTGDEHLRKGQFMDFTSSMVDSKFSQSGGSASGFGAGSSIARARPRSHTPTAAQMLAFGGGGGGDSMGSLSSFVFGNSNSSEGGGDGSGGGFGNNSSISTSPLTLMASGGGGATAGQRKGSTGGPHGRIPIAMATNEYFHAWLRPSSSSTTQSPTKPVTRVFGTVMISVPVSALRQLGDPKEMAPFRFSMRNAAQIKSILPNKKLVQTGTGIGTGDAPPPSPQSSDSHSFTIDRKALAGWLAEQQKARPESAFHNVDILRYVLVEEAYEPPLLMENYWKVEPLQTDLRIDYRLNPANDMQSALLNIEFTTTVSGAIASVQSQPEAKRDAQRLTWTLTELSKHGEGEGSLKARIKLESGGPSEPANTSVQFQISDSSISKVAVGLDDEEHFQLTMLRRKVVAGRYFSEPNVK